MIYKQLVWSLGKTWLCHKASLIDPRVQCQKLKAFLENWLPIFNLLYVNKHSYTCSLCVTRPNHIGARAALLMMWNTVEGDVCYTFGSIGTVVIFCNPKTYKTNYTYMITILWEYLVHNTKAYIHYNVWDEITYLFTNSSNVPTVPTLKSGNG